MRLPRSRQTLLGRVYEQVRLEADHDVDALYRILDPEVRVRREALPGEPERTIARIRSFVAPLRSAVVEEVEIVEATRSCERYGGRPAALVRSIVRYDEAASATELRVVWVRERAVWYSTDPRWS